MRRRLSEFVRSRSNTSAELGSPQNGGSQRQDGNGQSASTSAGGLPPLHPAAGRARSQSDAPFFGRRRAQSDYIAAERLSQRKVSGATGGMAAGTSSSPRSSTFQRSRSASGRYSQRNVHAVDLQVLESMQLPEDHGSDDDMMNVVDLQADERKSVAAEDEDEEEDENCLICMGKFTAKRPAITIPCTKKCNLAPVHAKCIFEWKEQKKGSNCPLCRSDLGPVNYTPPDLLNLASLVMFNYRKSFCMNPIPLGAGMIRCYIIAKNGFFGSPVNYQFFMQAPTTLKYPMGVLPDDHSPHENDRLLMTARKRMTKFMNSIIDVSLDERGKDFAPSKHNFVGQVVASVSGLEHTITIPYQSEVHSTSSRGVRELAAVSYTQNRVGSASGPRRMRVVLAAATEASEVNGDVRFGESASSSENQVEVAISDEANGDDDSDSDDEEELQTKKYITQVHRPTTKGNSMLNILRNHIPPSEQQQQQQQDDNPSLLFGGNKEPYWLDSIQAYSLDFQGRVTLPSNKNFQLELEREQNKISMQFGKVVASDDGFPMSIYTVDFQWPLSPLQAFGIALTACDRKLAVA